MSSGIVKVSPELLALIGEEAEIGLQTFSREIFLLEVVVAGTTHCPEIKEIQGNLGSGAVLRMIRDPKNLHDDKAIALYFGETRIGWVPRRLNLIISRLMDAGKAFFCRVEKARLHDNWVKITANIYMVE